MASNSGSCGIGNDEPFICWTRLIRIYHYSDNPQCLISRRCRGGLGHAAPWSSKEIWAFRSRICPFPAIGGQIVFGLLAEPQPRQNSTGGVLRCDE
jgi:hypothetical protein